MLFDTRMGSVGTFREEVLSRNMGMVQNIELKGVEANNERLHAQRSRHNTNASHHTFTYIKQPILCLAASPRLPPSGAHTDRN
jgi:hypothetical protein